jgi:hypothetical protein
MVCKSIHLRNLNSIRRRAVKSKTLWCVLVPVSLVVAWTAASFIDSGQAQAAAAKASAPIVKLSPANLPVVPAATTPPKPTTTTPPNKPMPTTQPGNGQPPPPPPPTTQPGNGQPPPPPPPTTQPGNGQPPPPPPPTTQPGNGQTPPPPPSTSTTNTKQPAATNVKLK